MQMEQVTEPAGSVAADALSLGVYSRVVIVQPLSEALNGLRDTIPDRLFADLKSTYESLRDAILLETRPGHFAQIADEFISLSDRVATKFGDLKPFYDLGVMLGEIGVEVGKICSCVKWTPRVGQWDKREFGRFWNRRFQEERTWPGFGKFMIRDSRHALRWML